MQIKTQSNKYWDRDDKRGRNRRTRYQWTAVAYLNDMGASVVVVRVVVLAFSSSLKSKSVELLNSKSLSKRSIMTLLFALDSTPTSSHWASRLLASMLCKRSLYRSTSISSSCPSPSSSSSVAASCCFCCCFCCFCCCFLAVFGCLPVFDFGGGLCGRNSQSVASRAVISPRSVHSVGKSQ